MGYTDSMNLPLHWGGEDSKNVLWKSPLKGQGHASPIIWGDRIFVCTAHWPPEVRDRTKVIPEHHVLCYDLETGKLHWDSQVPPGPWLRMDFRSGPGGGYAAPTPATDGKRVFCIFGSSVIAALDFNGNIVWRKEIIPHTFDVTIGSSPIIYRDTVILLCAMAKRADSKVIALDKTTGRIQWESMLPTTGFGHSTPVIIQVEGKPQMLVAASGGGPTPDALQSLDPADGKRLWWCRGAGDAASPAYGGGLTYFDSGRGGPGVAVDPTGRGDVSATHIRWTLSQVPEGIGSPIIIGGYVYRLHAPRILKCWKLENGEEVYAKRLEGLTTTWASPIADPKETIYFATAGKSLVIQGGFQFELLASNNLEDGNHTSPAVAGGKLILVGLENVYCIGEKEKESKQARAE